MKDAYKRHLDDVDVVIASGNRRAIKELYGKLGSYLAEEYAANIEQVPQLSYSETTATVVDLLRDTQGLLLDAGCGPNPRIAIELSRSPRRRVVAVDIGLDTVKLAQARARMEGTALIAVVADLESLPFSAGSFDALVCDDTIEHLPDDRGGIVELNRVLRPSGQAVIATPNRQRLDVVYRRARDVLHGRRQPAGHYFAAASHLREYTWPSAIALVRNEFELETRGFVPWPAGSVKKRLANWLTRRWPLRRFSRVVVFRLRPRRDQNSVERRRLLSQTPTRAGTDVQ